MCFRMDFILEGNTIPKATYKIIVFLNGGF